MRAIRAVELIAHMALPDLGPLPGPGSQAGISEFSYTHTVNRSPRTADALRMQEDISNFHVQPLKMLGGRTGSAA